MINLNKIIFSVIILTLSGASIALGSNSEVISDKTYSKAPEPLWERFGQIWKMDVEGREAAAEKRLAAFIELKDIAEQEGHPQLGFRAWDAIRVQLVILKRPTEEIIHATAECNKWAIIMAKQHGRDSHGNITMLANLYSKYRDIGQLGNAQDCYRKMLEMYVGIDGCDADGNPVIKRGYLGYNHFLKPHIHQLKLQGKPLQALDYHTQWLSKTDITPEVFDENMEKSGWWKRGTIVSSLDTQAELLAYLDRRKEALDLRKDILKNYPLENGYESWHYYNSLTDYIVQTAETEEEDPYIKDLIERCVSATELTDIQRIRILKSQSKSAEALALVEKALKAHLGKYGDTQYSSDLQAYYRLHAELMIEFGDYQQATVSLEKALKYTRHFGDIIDEPGLFWIRGRNEQLKDCFSTAFDSYQQAIELFGKFGRPVKTIEVSVDLIYLYGEHGMFDEAALLWDSVNRKIASMELPQEVRKQVADARKWLDNAIAENTDSTTLEPGNAEPAALTETSPNREQDASDNREAERGALNLHLVRLDPYSVDSILPQGESARMRFALSNLGASVAVGRLSLKGADSTQEYDKQAGEVHYHIQANSENSYPSTPVGISIGAGEQIHIFVDVAVLDTDKLIELQWQGRRKLIGKWSVFIAENDAPALQIVHQARAQSSRFHVLPIYHEVYMRQPASEYTDLRVVASTEIRIELWDVDTGELIAVDCNGNGSFKDSGDILSIDRDLSMYPDIKTAEGDTVHAIELLVYPHKEAITEKVQLSLQTRDEMGWLEHVVDEVTP